MAKKKSLKIGFLVWDIANIIEIIGALFIFFYIAQVVRGNPLVIGLIIVAVAFIIKVLDYNIRKFSA